MSAPECCLLAPQHGCYYYAIILKSRAQRKNWHANKLPLYPSVWAAIPRIACQFVAKPSSNEIAPLLLPCSVTTLRLGSGRALWRT